MDYKKSGVNIDAGNEAVKRILPKVKSTYLPQVMSDLGGFAAGFSLPTGYEEPILVSCTDGVGTKLRLAIELDRFDTVGIDLVAMSVNDLVCMGAKPLFFLDYIACHELIPDQIEQIIDGIVSGCKDSNCSLIGGEMAEMNDMYRRGDFDLAGFCVGIVDRKKVIDGKSIQPGDKIYGLPSSGVHSNGFSLVRKVLTEEVCNKNGIDRAQLLEPTKIYVKQIHSLLEKYKLTGIAHITGGGLVENIDRILPEGVHLTIHKNRIPKLPVFDWIQTYGNVAESEMYRVFNMGIGMVVITPNALPDSDDYIYLGDVKEGPSGVSLV